MKISSTLLALSFLAPRLLNALDLTPNESTRDLEGFKIPLITFADAPRQVRWQPPTKWALTGTAKKLTLYPPLAEQASMRIELHPGKTENGEPTADNSPEQFEAWAQQFLPQDATETILLGENASPFTLGGRTSREFTFTYLSQSRRFSTSVAIVDLSPKERLAVIVSARAADFAALHDEAVASMFRWEWSEP